MTSARLIAIAVLAAAVSAAIFFLPVREGFALLERYLESLGILGPLVYVLIYLFCTVLLIPGSVLTIGSGTLFGLSTGFAVVLLGANLGALTSFLLARTFLRRQVENWTAAHPKFRALDGAIARQGFKMVLLMRLSPVFPFVLLNYFLGITAVRVGSYVMANLLGMLPATFLFVYIGATARNALAVETHPADFYLQVLKFVGLAATVAVVILMTRIARKALRFAEQQEEGSFLSPSFSRAPQHAPAALEQIVLPGNEHDRRLLENCRPRAWRNPEPATKYNLVVIGGGTAGLVSGVGAVTLGAKVALIERNLMGGDCLNTGCVPSKALLSAARAAAEFGFSTVTPPDEVFARAMERMRRVRADISVHDSAERFRKLGVDVFFGEAKFTGPSRVEVSGQRLDFTRAVIATGSRPKPPAVPGLEEVGYLTSETVFALSRLPRRVAIIGAGPVGCELAQAFSRFGAEVFLIEALHGVLPNEDRDAAELVGGLLTARDGVRLACCGKELQIGKIASGGKRLTVESHGEKHEFIVDEIVGAAGRLPNVEGLGLEVAGVVYSSDGVLVDDRLQTSSPKIFAAGDVCSKYRFTHAADAMARIAIANALFPAKRKVTNLVIPQCIYTDPEVAHVGYYEDDARAAGYTVATITERFDNVDRAVLDGKSDGFAKVHYDRKNGRILGGTVVARHAGEIISELTLAMVARQSVGILSSTIHPYPTRAEALRKIGDAYMRSRLTPFAKKALARWFAWRCK